MNRQEVIRLACKAGASVGQWGDAAFTYANLERFAALVASEERKACIEDARTVGGDFSTEFEALVSSRGAT